MNQHKTLNKNLKSILAMALLLSSQAAFALNEKDEVSQECDFVLEEAPAEGSDILLCDGQAREELSLAKPEALPLYKKAYRLVKNNLSTTAVGTIALVSLFFNLTQRSQNAALVCDLNATMQGQRNFHESKLKSVRDALGLQADIDLEAASKGMKKGLEDAQTKSSSLQKEINTLSQSLDSLRSDLSVSQVNCQNEYDIAEKAMVEKGLALAKMASLSQYYLYTILSFTILPRDFDLRKGSSGVNLDALNFSDEVLVRFDAQNYSSPKEHLQAAKACCSALKAIVSARGRLTAHAAQSCDYAEDQVVAVGAPEAVSSDLVGQSAFAAPVVVSSQVDVACSAADGDPGQAGGGVGSSEASSAYEFDFGAAINDLGKRVIAHAMIAWDSAKILIPDDEKYKDDAQFVAQARRDACKALDLAKEAANKAGLLFADPRNESHAAIKIQVAARGMLARRVAAELRKQRVGAVRNSLIAAERDVKALAAALNLPIGQACDDSASDSTSNPGEVAVHSEGDLPLDGSSLASPSGVDQA